MATAAVPQPVTDRYDMSPAAIYSEDRWQQPFAEIRKAGGIVTLTQHSQIDHGPEGVTTAPFDDQLASIAAQLITAVGVILVGVAQVID